jgi:hypothetical protein
MWLTSVTFGIVAFKAVPIGAHVLGPASLPLLEPFLEKSLRDALDVF